MQLRVGSIASDRPGAQPGSSPAAAGVGRRLRGSPWLALLVGLMVASGVVGLWQALLAQEHEEVRHSVALNLETVRNEIVSRMEGRVLALARMARRWEVRGRAPREEWEDDARLYVTHDAGYLAIGRVETDLRADWVAVRAASAASVAREFSTREQRDALEQARARREVLLTRPFGLSTGERVLQVNVPVFRGESLQGYVVGVFHVGRLLEALLHPSVAPGYAIVVRDGEEVLYRRTVGVDPLNRDWNQEITLRLYGATWRVDASPGEPLLYQRSLLPLAVLAGGLLLAVVLSLAVRFAQMARLRAREAESVNRELGEVIAEHRQANERLRKLSRAVEQSPTMVLITDRGGAVEYVNPRFSQMTGYTLEEIAGENPRLLKSGETGSEEYRDLWETITAGGEWRGVFHDRKKNGELFWVQSAISPIRDARGAITHFLAEMEDITERRQLEQQVAERNREIVKSQALAAMGQAASMIAHDLRNPLSTIKMGLQMLSKKPPHGWTDAEQELLQISQGQVRYMEEVLSDLLSYSAPDALNPEWLSVAKLLDSAVMLSQKPIEEHKVQVKTYYQAGLPVLFGDANKLRQAFVNLLVNGAQATAARQNARPTLVVDARLRLPAEDRPSIQVEICDNGCGIAPEHLDKVFEPFFTTRAQGTGLGLPIAKRIVDQHHGSISLQAEPPHGTRVTVVLPLAPAHERNGS